MHIAECHDLGGCQQLSITDWLRAIYVHELLMAHLLRPTVGMKGKEPSKQESIKTIKAQAEMTKNSVKQTVRELADCATGGGWLRIGERKQAAARHLDTATAAVLDAADRLRSDDQEVVARPLVELANSVNQLTYFLDAHSPAELADKAAGTVRRHPVTSLGLALLAGAATARVIRASSQS